MKALSIPKIKHYHYCYTSFPSLHNGCVPGKVIMKMYRLNFYYQITEQLHYEIIGKRFLTDWNEDLMYAGVQVQVGSVRIILEAVSVLAVLSRSSYLPLLSLLGLVIPESTPAVSRDDFLLFLSCNKICMQQQYFTWWP